MSPETGTRTRFAPSPTGTLHLGGARTALFNWLYARNKGGKFILRIEDTDAERSTRESVDEIIESLKWLGLDWDEGPFHQSERTALYNEKLESLVKAGKAYRCYCSKEELDAKREELQTSGKKPMYDRKCRDSGRDDTSAPHVVRFRMPLDGTTAFVDSLRGVVEMENSELDDFILRRTDGGLIYNFVVVVDDSEMGITNVIRGDDHIANTPRQVNIYKALGAKTPEFTHVSMILGKDKKRLSKRHGADSVLALREAGFIQDAVVNMLARLGWGHGDQELFSREELVEKFRLDNITMSPAIFDPEKLLWLNAQHIKRLDDEKLSALALPFVRRRHPQASESELKKLLPLFRERSRSLVELAEGTDFFYAKEVVYDESAKAKFLDAQHRGYLGEVLSLVEANGVADSARLNEEFNALAERLGVKMKEIAQPVRVALTGSTVSPGIFEMMSLIGKEETVSRLKRAV